MPSDLEHIARLYEIAAFERPLSPAERVEVGFDTVLDDARVVELGEIAAFERPLDERDLVELLSDLVA
jgi:hypothetical protein